MKKLIVFMLSVVLFSCSSDKNSSSNSNLVYVDIDDVEVKKIEGTEKAYYEGKPLTGILVYTWRNKTAENQYRLFVINYTEELKSKGLFTLKAASVFTVG